MVLPAGSILPPLSYLLVLAGLTIAVGLGLWQASPQISERTVLGLVPWMSAGATLYVSYELAAVPGLLAPLASSPTVYLSVAIMAGAVWLGAIRVGKPPARWIAISGGLMTVVGTVGAVIGGNRFAPIGPLLAVVVAAVVAGLLWWILRAWEPNVEVLGWAGTMLVFGHAVDAFTTAAGVVHLGFGERSPLARVFIDWGAGFAIPVLGEAWLFVLVKLVLAAAVAWLLAPSARHRPREGFLLVTLVTAVGLGPGIHNAVLFAVASP